jgi:hypothetical protein
MRSVFDSINCLNLKSIKDGSNLKIFIPLKDKLISYLYDNSKIEKVKEFPYNDEILDYHIDNENVIIIGKVNKSITTFDKNANKLSER